MSTGRSLIKHSSSLYKNPHYYEVAFSFRNVPREMAFFRKAINRFSKVGVKKVLELACGTSPYLEEWHRWGCKYFGLDRSWKMLDFAKKRAESKKIDAKFIRADMNKFFLGNPRVDLVYLLLGSLYTKSNDEFLAHLDSVSRVLKSGGLYILEGAVWFNVFGGNKQSWTISRAGIKAKTIYRTRLINPITQMFREEIDLEITDGGKDKRIYCKAIRKLFFPQEFLALVRCHRKFEFLGWFDDFNISKPVSVNPQKRKLVVLRKK